MNAVDFYYENKCTTSAPTKGVALVAEGGGQRGIFTAGILDSWLVKDFNPFDLLIGTSAGAQNLSSYMAKQLGYAKKSIMELSSHPQFFNLKRSFIGGSSVNLDWYFDPASHMICTMRPYGLVLSVSMCWSSEALISPKNGFLLAHNP